ncbi:uncharacterized protein N7473_010019 [Penicillium subrubescens]|uniref:uncharacterized protein n=1 Tax=Penicillium subrubescens TaxID=1316194 RepID=UPI0025453506|nr:uncharacterized protein N7473_010019 [Penicillium subrubescens]KAJ5883133.1 hypothetical protein N7473_010019 [Penicillium subrubescens]
MTCHSKLPPVWPRRPHRTDSEGGEPKSAAKSEGKRIIESRRQLCFKHLPGQLQLLGETLTLGPGLQNELSREQNLPN